MRALLCLSILAAQTAWGLEYQPSILRKTLENVKREVGVGRRPIVVFDLDDTLIDSRERTLRVFHEMARNPGFRSRHPNEATRIGTIRLSDIGYSSEGALRRIGVQDARVLKEAKAYWFKRFFSSAYIADDVPLPGAVHYVRSLWNAGAYVIYLTGRTEETMGEGTRLNLPKRGFPLGDDRARLIAQHGEDVPDLEFKHEMLGKIAQWGTIVALFENEAVNLNMMHGLFPKALSIFLDTVHSDKPDVPAPGIYWVRDYTGR